MASKSEQRGSTAEHARRRVPDRLRPFEAVIERMMMGQLAQPPETAIAAPLQQAISNLQSGGRGALPGGMANLPNGGLQSREQLGLPARSSYFPTGVTLDELNTLGALPEVPPNLNRGVDKQRRKYERQKAKRTAAAGEE